jgi:cytochrome c553
MTGLLTNLSDQDLADIAAYFSSQKGSVGAADPKLVARGEALFRGGNLEKGMPACTGCHSPNGAGNAAAGFPHLGGQHAQYVAKQLTDFREEAVAPTTAMPCHAHHRRKLSNEDIEAVPATFRACTNRPASSVTGDGHLLQR